MRLRSASLYTFSNAYSVLGLPYGTVRCRVGAIWCRMVEVGAVWCHMVEVGAIWCHMVECGVFEMWVTIPSSLKCADCNSLKCAGL
jgi:hypothetical protein